VLYVDTPILLLEATVLNLAGSLYVPEPVVLSSSGAQSVVVVRSIKPILDDAFSNSVREAITQLHERILKAIQTIGQREAAFHSTQSEQAVPV
jgi:predicted thioredoxin/glutaredoxin